MNLTSSWGQPYSFRNIKHLNNPRGRSRKAFEKNKAFSSVGQNRTRIKSKIKFNFFLTGFNA